MPMEITVLHWMVSLVNLLCKHSSSLWYLYMIVLSLHGTESGQLYIWGRALIGEHDDDQPRPVFPSLGISQVALGWHHALVLSGMWCVVPFQLKYVFWNCCQMSKHSAVTAGELYTIGAYRHRKLDPHVLPSAEPVQRLNPATTSHSHDGSPFSILVILCHVVVLSFY